MPSGASTLDFGNIPDGGNAALTFTLSIWRGGDPLKLILSILLLCSSLNAQWLNRKVTK